MTRPPHPDTVAAQLPRRRFGQLTALALAAGTAPLVLSSRAAAAEGAGQAYYDRARGLAGTDPVLCALAKALTPGVVFKYPPAPAPIRLFDNLAMLSAGWVSAMAVLTDDGIILIDSLTSPADADNFIVPGLRELGADPATIKYIVVTHGHYDHLGGAQLLADRYGARVMMSPADWDLVARTRPANAPVRDLEITDGQRLTLGGTTISLHYTPGHTPGTVSPIFPVRTGGRHHTAMLWGGMNPPATLPELRTYLASVQSFRARTARAGVDVELSNHPNDHGLQRVEQLRDQPGGPNPFVLGHHRVDRFLAVMDTMLRGRIADAETTTVTSTPRAQAMGAHACC
ncbi:MBL fold metallo-hydrolase [Kitasatospora sp. RB6PN24]|uniref:MBL fold metallo-hydrolase n=1 Tax=Kitasatospora humi TaxID=2893891 RepID=UPI001E55FCD5|nr:MBL fold metallo-hydrolase [Kitasatospora humi]MCC9306194.1 MBL fold metallo-hydrolase [Kitasatospora humi]